MVRWYCLLGIGLAAGIGGSAAVCPTPVVNAFTGCYYSNTSLSGDPAFIRIDPQINFYWGNQSPDPSLPPLDFSVRWQGNFTFSAGTYTFNAVMSDGMRIYVDGNLILSKWQDQPPYGYTATAAVSQGTHLVTVEYYERLGGATAQVSWQNTTPPAPSSPVISSFTATPPAISPGQPAVLSWAISGATTAGIDNGIGGVSTNSQTTVWPAQTTTYTLTASSGTDTTTAVVTVTVNSGAGPAPDTQAPSAPTLTSAAAVSATEVDLAWTRSTDNVGVAGYQITRNGSVVALLTGAALNYADTSVSASSTYIYSVTAYDATKNYSAASNSIQVSTPAAVISSGQCPAPASNAFTGCYYSNTNLSGNPVFVRTDPQINFYWGNKSPDPSLPPLDFSVQWQGNFTFSGGAYTFNAVMSDGMRIYADGNLILDKWQDQPAYAYTATAQLTQGTHLITVDYYERLGGATAQVTWQNTAPPAPSAPVISSFTATPSAATSGQPVVLSWSVSGATTIGIDHGIGNVSTDSQVTVWPAQTTAYTLTASSGAGTTTAIVTVNVQSGSGPGPDTQAPTAPTLTSATAASPTEVDLAWTPSTDNVGVAGYQVTRNGSVVASVAGATLNYADTAVSANSTYIYSVTAYDAASNYSAASNSIQAATPAGSNSDVSMQWLGACWQPFTTGGVTHLYQAIDFVLTTANPVPVQATLFFTPNCDPSQGTDNMNDFNTLTGSSHMIRGFTHFPDVTPTSAYYWVGPLTPDGKCAPGAPCSGCVTYTKTTPLCTTLP